MKQFLKKHFPILVTIRRWMSGIPESPSARIVAAKNSPEEIFTEIYRENAWGDPESASGSGSNIEETAVLRSELPGILQRLGVETLLDASCGDFYWLSQVELSLKHYYGYDIVPEMIEENRKKYETSNLSFRACNIISGELPEVDAIFCRDALVHLSFEDIGSTLENFRSSGARFLLTTNFPSRTENIDIPTGHWRPINFELEPFSFPAPSQSLLEKSRIEGFEDKSLAIWEIAGLPAVSL